MILPERTGNRVPGAERHPNPMQRPALTEARVLLTLPRGETENLLTLCASSPVKRGTGGAAIDPSLARRRCCEPSGRRNNNTAHS